MDASLSQKLLVSQLLATRDSLLAQQATMAAAVSQIETSLLALDVDVDRLTEVTAEDVQAECPHPIDQVENLHTTLDDAADDWICHVCGKHQTDPFHP